MKPRLSVVWIVVSLFVGCGAAPAGSGPCGTCHIDPGQVESPFRGLDGVTDPLDEAVGAHDIHLESEGLTRKMDCATCHFIPGGVGDFPQHYVGGRADVVFDDRARVPGLDARWDPETRTCVNVACHGAARAAALSSDLAQVDFARTPRWNQRAEEEPCERCHGSPPAEMRSTVPHPPGADCQTCHPNVAGPGTIIDVEAHMNGVVDAI